MKRHMAIVLVRSQFAYVAADADVLPLRPDLWLEAVERFGAARVRDLHDVLGPREICRLRCAQARAMARVIAAARADRREPWLEGAGLYELSRALPILAVMRALLERLARDYERISVFYACEVTESWRPDILSWLWSSLFHAAEDARRSGLAVTVVGRPAAGSSFAKSGRGEAPIRAIQRFLGRIVCRWFSRLDVFFKARGVVAADAVPRADVVLAGIQVTDVVSQAPLAIELEKRLGERFLWIRGQPARELEARERSWAAAGSAVARKLDASDVEQGIWRWWPLAAWSSWYMASRLASFWREGTRPAPAVREDTAADFIFARVRGNSLLKWRKWDRILRRAGCRVMLGSSNIFEMATMVSWAQRQDVPFLMMPHGFFHDTVNLYPAMAADYVACLGPGWPAVFASHRTLPKPKEALNVGGLFLDASTEPGRGPTAHGRDVLFIASHDMADPLSDSPRGWVEWFRALGRACREADVTLVLRGHPRKKPGTFYEDVVADIKVAGGRARVDDADSLDGALDGKLAAVSRCLDTAAVRGILLGVPVFGFLASRQWPPQNRFLREICVLAGSEAALADRLRRLADSPDERAAEVRRQREALRPWVDTSVRDGHARVVEWIERIADRNAPPARSRSRAA